MSPNYRYLIDFEVGNLSYLPKYYVPWKCKVISKLLSTFMFVLLLTMTCNQHNGIQILYNIYVSVSNKYLIIIYFWVLTNQNYIVPLCIVLLDFLVHMYVIGFHGKIQAWQKSRSVSTFFCGSSIDKTKGTALIFLAILS